jgi:hypothetical protein
MPFFEIFCECVEHESNFRLDCCKVNIFECFLNVL